MFPICLKSENSIEPVHESIYFVLAENGLFLVKNLDLFRASVKVEGIPWFQPHQDSLQLKFPRLPRTLVEACMGFFYEVYRRHRSEAIVLLFFSPATGSFRVGVPSQQVPFRGRLHGSSCRVDYEHLPTPEGFLRLGTWHSHADFKAYHSLQDDLDEMNQDGLHIVAGDLDCSQPSFSFSFMVNGQRFILDKEDVFQGYDRPRLPPPAKWLERVACVDQLSSVRKHRTDQTASADE